MLELLRSLFARRCPAVMALQDRDRYAGAVHCDERRGHGLVHVADRGMDEIRWIEVLA